MATRSSQGGPWHRAWQECFRQYGGGVDIEKPFGEKQRRCDVSWCTENGDTIVVEIQHSLQILAEPAERLNDYCNGGAKLIWILDGTEESAAANGLHTLLMPSKNQSGLEYLAVWKLRLKPHAYRAAEAVFMDLGDDNIVLCHFSEDTFPTPQCAVTKHFKDRAEFVKFLIKADSLEQLRNFRMQLEMPQLETWVNPAGSGKTWSLMQRVVNDNDATYTFVLAKEHAAKDVLHAEWKKQQVAAILEELPTFEVNNSAYVYTMHNGRLIFIATIDSFIWALAPANKCEVFAERLQAMYSDIANPEKKPRLSRSSDFPYKGKRAVLNHTAKVYIDEATKLPPITVDALERLSSSYGVAICLVGDIAQSTAGPNALLKVWKRNPHNYSRGMCRFGPNIYKMVRNVVRYTEIFAIEPPVLSIEAARAYTTDGRIEMEVLSDSFYYSKRGDAGEGFDRICGRIVEIIRNESRTFKNPNDYLIVMPYMSCVLLRRDKHKSTSCTTNMIQFSSIKAAATREHTSSHFPRESVLAKLRCVSVHPSRNKLTSICASSHRDLETLHPCPHLKTVHLECEMQEQRCSLATLQKSDQDSPC